MRMGLILRLFIAILFAMTASAQTNLDRISLGITRITTEAFGKEIPIRIFYPTSEMAVMTEFGPWKIEAARNAEIQPGAHPLVLISHGLNGTDWNHHLLAAELVRRGFIVAALQHADDLLRVGHPEQLSIRPLELQSSLDALLADHKFGAAIDSQRIGAYGYSAGGYTVLAAAGGQYDYERTRHHCLQNVELDPNYCIGEPGGAKLPLVLRLRRSLYRVPPLPETFDVIDTRIRAVVAAAPVGVPFTHMSRVKQPVLLLRAGEDLELRAPFHVDHIHNLLPHEHQYEIIEGLHHYAFLSPFPDQIAHDVGEPAKDPEGFDRRAFLAKTNIRIADFFVSHLMEP